MAETELLKASDQEITDAVAQADKTVLRGLLYHLTGDESLVGIKSAPLARGFITVQAVTDPADIKLLETKTVDFLKAYRDGGAGELPDAPPERLRKSLSLAAGADIAERELGMWIEELALDPFARGFEWPKAPDAKTLEDFKVLLIGSGMNGLNTAAQLKHLGIPFVVVEKNADVGGTWYENVYPGARVDTPSRGYSFICATGFDHPYAYGPQSDNFKYTRWMAEKHDVLQHFEFETEVKSLTWDEKAKLWEVVGEGPKGTKTWRVNAVISAVGFLSRPNVPKLEGEDEFKGALFHTARWPKGLDVKGKRVAVVGSGSSGYQLFPVVAELAEHAYLFQRTPSWVFDVEGYLTPLPPKVNWLERNVPLYRNFLRFRSKWLHGPNILGHVFNADPKTNAPIREQRLKFLQDKFAKHPELLEKMMPKYPPNASRPVLCDSKYGVYDALMRDNTTLVTDGIARLTKNGIVDGKGKVRKIKIIFPNRKFCLCSVFRFHQHFAALEKHFNFEEQLINAERFCDVIITTDLET